MSFDLDDPKLTAYALGELDEAERAEMEARLANDPAARGAVEQLRQTGELVRGELAREPLSAAVQLRATTVRRPVFWRVAIGAVAACLVVALGVFILLPSLNRARETATDRRVASYMDGAAPALEVEETPPINTQTELSVAPLTAMRARPSGVTALRSQNDAKAPHDGFVRFPGNWPDLSEGRGRADTAQLSPRARLYYDSTPAQAATAFDPTDLSDSILMPRDRSVATERGEQAEDRTVVAQLQKRLPEVRLENSSFADVVDFLRDVSGANIFVNWRELEEVGITRDTPVNLTMRDVKFNDALRAVLDDAQRPGVRLHFGIEEGVITISTRELPPPNFNTESYDRIIDNPFLDATQNPLSTFSIDVDTASYSNVRRFLTQGQLPPKDAVRIEEMLNYFTYDYAAPREEGAAPFSSSVEVASCPWNARHRLVRVALKGKEVARDERPDSNLVFLIDVSGSMQPANKLPLLKQAMAMLVKQLGEKDRVAIVVYAGSSGLVLPSTSCDEKGSILNALASLQPGGSTNGAQGIELAYEIATQHFIKGGVNRVILCTDGDFNVGVTDQGALTRLIEEKAKTGVFLSVLGFGMGNVKDSTMEKLADKGNGNYGYVDTIAEAKKLLVEQMSGTLVTIAKDVKVQVEFNPARVASYRLIGYENRMLAKEDFNDDRKDAGEIGAGHAVTALYEVVPMLEPAGKVTPEQRRELFEQRQQEKERAAVEAARGRPATQPVDPLKYQKPAELSDAAKGDEVLTLKLRYKEPDGDTSKLLEFPVTDGGATYAQASGDFKFAASVAAFGMILRDSPHKGQVTLDGVIELAEEGKGADANGYRGEFIELVRKAKELTK